MPTSWLGRGPQSKVEFEGAFIHLIVRDDQRYDIFADDHDRRFYETDDQRLSGDECFVETIGKKNGYSVKLSDGIDTTVVVATMA
jgi:hypothetical protein